MAGAATTPLTNIVSNESRNTVGPKLAALAEDATFANFSDAEADSTIAIQRVQGTAPTAVENDFWQDTATRTSRIREGASGQERWQPQGWGMSLKNGTGGSRSANDVVGVTTGTVADLGFNDESNGDIVAGVVRETIADSSFGLVQINGVCTVNTNGAVARGDFLTKAGSAIFRAVINGVTGSTVLDKSFAIALTATGVGDGSVTAYVFGYNGTS